MRIAQKGCGISVPEAALGGLIATMTYKVAVPADRRAIAVDGPNTTMCSRSGALTGTSGVDELAVRVWERDACGVSHDRGFNAAVNILAYGPGYSLKVPVTGQVTGWHSVSKREPAGEALPARPTPEPKRIPVPP